MSSPREITVRALEKEYNLAADNLFRAQHLYKGCTPSQLNTLYGQSDETRQDVLDRYQKYHDEVAAALKWLAEVVDGEVLEFLVGE